MIPQLHRIPSKHRIMISRIIAVIVLAYVVALGPSDYLPPGFLLICEMLGYIGLSAAALGRIWCLLFIAGKKSKVLTTEGPYSMVRNPLYVFSFIGAVGFGLAVENPLLALLIGLTFIMFYPRVIRGEEAHLKAIHGEEYEAYCRRTPRWIPKLSLYKEPEFIEVRTRQFREGILDAMWFLWAFLLWEILEGLQDLHILHLWFNS